MGDFEQKYNKLLEKYSYFAEEENTKPTIEDIFVRFCDAFANDLRDMELGEIKHKFEDFEILSKLIAYKHLKDNKESIADLEYLLNETL